MTAGSDDASPAGLDFAWRVHGALDSWTGKVDTKASITLAIESAILGFVVALSRDGERLAALHGGSRTAYLLGVTFLSAAVLCSLLVVMPQLRRWQARKEWRSGMIYFGHLRHWNSADLARELKRPQLYEKQLAAQLVAMSRIAWKKHARLQRSVALLIAGGACLAYAIVSS